MTGGFRTLALRLLHFLDERLSASFFTFIMRYQKTPPEPVNVAPVTGVMGAGFTLIEVLVTLVILSVGIVAVLGSFNVSITSAGAAREAMSAQWALEERLSEIRRTAVTARVDDVLALSGRFETVNGFQGLARMALQDSAPEGASNVLVQVTLQAWKSNENNRHESECLVLARR